MKKALSLVLAAAMTLSITGCGNGKIPTDETVGETVNVPEQTQPQHTEAVPETTKATEPEKKVQYDITDTSIRTWSDSIGSQWVQAIVEITNTGTSNLYLSDGSYDLEDAEGHLVASRTMVSVYPDVLAPGEKGYMYEDTILDQPVDGELTVLPRVDVEEATVDLIRYNVTDTVLSDEEYGGLKVLGRIENTGSQTESFIYVTAILYNAEGNCIGRIFTIITEELAPGDKIGFEMSESSLPDDVTADSVADIVYYAYPAQMQF